MDIFNEGRQAAWDGLEFWQNPYADPEKGPINFTKWQAGWCWGKQQMQGGQ
jgi:hypothetical protein